MQSKLLYRLMFYNPFCRKRTKELKKACELANLDYRKLKYILKGDKNEM